MTSPKSEFKFIDRGFKKLLVLIPGWATDCRIFLNLNLDYNYLLTTSLYPFDFEKALLGKLGKIKQVSLFGWSLGGFLAAQFASNNFKRIDELILLGIRKKFSAANLKDIELKLKQNKKAYLYGFYHECFSSSDTEAFTWFKKNLLREYINKIELNNLLYGLDYFAKASICPQTLIPVQKIRIFHGAKDEIAPLEEAIMIKNKISHAELVCLESTGHIPFLNPQFRGKFYNG